MHEEAPLKHIKTEQSENEKEQNTTKDGFYGSVHHQQTHSTSNYVCSICSRVRVSCPCSLANQSVSPFTYKLPINNNHRNERHYLNRTTIQSNLSASIPKISFTYAQPQEIRSRRNSLNVPLSTHTHSKTHNSTQYQLQSVVTTTFIPQVEEIIYYPVVHNRIKYETP